RQHGARPGSAHHAGRDRRGRTRGDGAGAGRRGVVTASPKGQPVVQFVRVSKSFGEVTAVDDISFDIYRGEFFSLLGPSGCGKTTTLRLLAGFEEPDDNGGEVRLLGETVNKKRPYERQVATVF